MPTPQNENRELRPLRARWWHWFLVSGLGCCFYGFIAGAVFGDRSGFASFLFGTGMLLMISSGISWLTAWLLKLSAMPRPDGDRTDANPSVAQDAYRWRRRLIVGLIASPIIAVIGGGIALLGLGIGFRGHTGDMQTGPILMSIGIGLVVASLVADVITVTAGVFAWRRGSGLGWPFLSLSPLLLKMLAVVIVALAR